MQALLAGYADLFSDPSHLLLIVVGVAVGLVFGSIPGLTGNMGVALALPLTYNMDPSQAMALLISILVGGVSGGLVSAIFINIPGTPSSIATAWDGYPMTLRGEGGKAMGTAVLTSFIGGLFSFAVLTFFTPVLADWALKFSSWDYAAIGFFSLTLIAVVVKGTVVKGLIGALIGVLLSMVGPAPVDGVPRFTFGSYELLGGFNILPIVVGIYAVSEAIRAAEGRFIPGQEMIAQKLDKIRGFGISAREYLLHWKNVLRSALIGTGVGILPGLGGNAASMISYAVAKDSSKHPETFGTGELDGLIASETANNASVGGALVPMMALGIPGSATAALLIAALSVHNLTPGPAMYFKNPDLIYSIFAICIIANVVFCVLELLGINLLVKCLSVPKQILIPLIMMMCIVGTYTVNNRLFDVYCILGFGLLGYLMSLCKIPPSATIMGYILGPIVELYFRRSMQDSSGSLLPLVSRPISLIFVILTVLSLAWAVRGNLRDAKAAKARAETVTKQ